MEHFDRPWHSATDAHGLVGRLVRKALDRGVRLSDLSLEEFREAHPELDASVYTRWARKSRAAMISYGSTGPSQVKEQVRCWKELLQRSENE